MDARVYWGCLVLLCVSSSVLPAQTPIYRCMVNGVATFTDRPCSAQAAPIELDTSRVSTFEPVPAAKVSLPQAARRKSPRKEPAVDKKQDRCVSIGSALRKIDARLRAGYSAKQGVQLQERRRDLRRQERELRC